MDQNKLQEKYLAFQQLDQQMQQIEKQIQAFDEHLAELESIQEWLDEIKTVKPGTEILVPVSQGIFIRTTLTDTSTMIVNVGGKTAVEKDPDSTKELLKEQALEITKSKSDALVLMENASKEAQKLQAELEQEMK